MGGAEAEVSPGKKQRETIAPPKLKRVIGAYPTDHGGEWLFNALGYLTELRANNGFGPPVRSRSQA